MRVFKRNPGAILIGLFVFLIMLASACQKITPLEKAAKEGNIEAQVELGGKYWDKWYTATAEQVKKAVKEGNTELQGIEPTKPEFFLSAIKWYTAAAEQGDIETQIFLGDLYYTASEEHLEIFTFGYPQIPGALRLAMKWYTTAAEQGDRETQYKLGGMYYYGEETGEGVPKDLKLAAKWYTKAAEQGHREAQYSIARRYQLGEGVLEDDEKAAEWLSKAADQGHVGAQYLLGVFYYYGSGVKKNIQTAIKLLLKAAEEGKWDASMVLAGIYRKEMNDLVRAHMWYNIANYYSPSGAASLTDLVAKLMTPEQIAEAQKLAREWMEKHQKE